MATSNENFITCVKTHNDKDFNGGNYKYVKYDSLLDREEVRTVVAEIAAEATKWASGLRVNDLLGNKSTAHVLFVLDRKVVKTLADNPATTKLVAGKKMPHAWGIVCENYESNKDKSYDKVKPVLVGQVISQLGALAVTNQVKEALVKKLFEGELENLANREECEVSELDRGAMIGAKRRIEGQFAPLSWKLAEILSELEQSWNGKMKDEERKAAKAAAAAAAAEAAKGLRSNIGLLAGALTGNRRVATMAAEYGEATTSTLTPEENALLGSLGGTKKSLKRSRSVDAV